MINRELVRLKVVQLVYADYKNGGKSTDDAMKELAFSLQKSYDLYHYLLLLITEVTDYARMRYDTLNERLKAIGSKDTVDESFINNRFAAQLAANKQLEKFRETPKTHSWTDNDDVVRRLYKEITSSDFYAEYVSKPDKNYNDDRELWRKAYKRFVCGSDDIASVLEEWSLYWNDDKDIVDTFVLKTIKRFDEAAGADQPLLPAYGHDEDRKFAGRLFETVLLHRGEFEKLIEQHTRNWDFSRIATMDIVIMDCALAEIIYFDQIEVNITLNEYINIAKLYSTPKSASYVNGTLDSIVRDLRKDGQLKK